MNQIKNDIMELPNILDKHAPRKKMKIIVWKKNCGLQKKWLRTKLTIDEQIF